MPTSRLQDARDEYHEYADFEEVADVSRAKKFVTAIRRILMLQPNEWRAGSVSHRHEKNLLQEELVRAQNYIASQEDNGGVVFLDPSQARLDCA